MFTFFTIRSLQNKSRIECLNFWLCATQGQVRRGTYFDVFPLFTEIGVMIARIKVISITANISSFRIQTRISDICITLCVDVYISSAFIICRTCINSVWTVLSPHLHPAINKSRGALSLQQSPAQLRHTLKSSFYPKLFTRCRVVLCSLYGMGATVESRCPCVSERKFIYII